MKKHTTTKTLLLGGSFNPIHNGHLIISRYIAESLGISKVLLIPSGNHPTKRKRDQLLPGDIRLEIIKEAIKNDPFFDVCDYELTQKDTTYTYKTIKWFQETFNKTKKETYWMIGDDIVNKVLRWHKIELLLETANIVVASRDPEKVREQDSKLIFVDTPLIDISSSNIRERVENNKSIDYLVPDRVNKYIKDNNLYE